MGQIRLKFCAEYQSVLLCLVQLTIADYPALSVDRAGGGNPLYAEDTPNQEFLIWCAPIQEFLIRCTNSGIPQLVCNKPGLYIKLYALGST